MHPFPRPASDGRRVLGVAAGLLLLLVAAVPAAEHTVNIGADGLSFDPAVLDIAVGDTVTWINDGGFHNVDADDGSFGSGPPSSDLWQYSHTFRNGGSFGYHCDTHESQGMTGTINVAGIFADGLEEGNTTGWTSVTGGLPNCNCYFSPDCEEPNGFCDWGNLTQEDICLWRLTKPTAPDTGCDAAYFGDWIAGICDGTCSPSTRGSVLGWEEQSVLLEGIQMWSDAMLLPAIAGGEPIDDRLVEQISGLPFRTADSAMNLGRQVADLFQRAGIPEYYDHFCHFEAHPGEHDPAIAVDLSADPCRAQLARNAANALLAEIVNPGQGAKSFNELPEACNERSGLFEPRCPDGPGALGCVIDRIMDTAVFMTTPSTNAPPIRFAVGD